MVFLNFCHVFLRFDVTSTFYIHDLSAAVWGRPLFVYTGSPFFLLVTGSPDASKVNAYGPGVENGLLSTFEGEFVVETAGAGPGELTVKVRGPRGSFGCLPSL